ncbi:MAG: nicotinate phosphoribosyltransferase [Tissierellia bacterium]|nr:nicotinate phosphoribosyltransferase [Tissierellia bacterium]
MNENWISMDKNNYTLLADFYEFAMGNGYFENNMGDTIVTFDMFFRSVPDNASYAIIAGLEQLIDYLEQLHFTDEDINFLRTKGIFSEEFLEYLRNFEFECDMWAMPEGTVAFPQEPLVIVRGPVIQAQLIETIVLLTINHQSMVATKANRIVGAAKGRPVIEFGSRRAQGYTGANLGARASYIGGCDGSANTLAEKLYGIPALGTMAHSWIQMFPTELEAFKTYAATYPDNCILLIDTYDTLKKGVPNAIKTFDEVLKPLGKRPKGVRIDSGDIAYLSKKTRQLLDEAGYEDCPIMASNSLDEFVIENLLLQGACVDSFGVGERLITSKSSPVFGGVYKLTGVERNGVLEPTIKISENVTKITTPGFKSVYRFYDKKQNKALADVIALHDEEIPEDEYEIFHPIYTWKRRVLTGYEVKPLLVQIYDKGKLVYDLPTLDEIREKVKKELDCLWEEMKRLDNPHEYIVDLSQELWNVKDELLATHGKKFKK